MPELEFNLNEGVLHVESCPYIIRTAVRNISGQRILMLYIYQRENILAGSIKPRWVVFQGRYDFATLSLRENASATWQCAPFDFLNRVCRFDTKCAFYRQQDEARTAHFCKCEHSAISALICLQWSISRRKALERKRKKQRAIIERMRYVPALPRDLKGFIHREVMPQYIFYDYQRKAPGMHIVPLAGTRSVLRQLSKTPPASAPAAKRRSHSSAEEGVDVFLTVRRCKCCKRRRVTDWYCGS